MSESAERFRRVAAGFTAARVREAVPEDRVERPAPCEGWFARDVVAPPGRGVAPPGFLLGASPRPRSTPRRRGGPPAGAILGARPRRHPPASRLPRRPVVAEQVCGLRAARPPVLHGRGGHDLHTRRPAYTWDLGAGPTGTSTSAWIPTVRCTPHGERVPRRCRLRSTPPCAGLERPLQWGRSGRRVARTPTSVDPALGFMGATPDRSAGSGSSPRPRSSPGLTVLHLDQDAPSFIGERLTGHLPPVAVVVSGWSLTAPMGPLRRPPRPGVGVEAGGDWWVFRATWRKASAHAGDLVPVGGAVEA